MLNPAKKLVAQALRAIAQRLDPQTPQQRIVVTPYVYTSSSASPANVNQIWWYPNA